MDLCKFTAFDVLRDHRQGWMLLFSRRAPGHLVTRMHVDSLVRQIGGVAVQVGHLLHVGGALLGVLNRGIEPVTGSMRL